MQTMQNSYSASNNGQIIVCHLLYINKSKCPVIFVCSNIFAYKAVDYVWIYTDIITVKAFVKYLCEIKVFLMLNHKHMAIFATACWNRTIIIMN